MSPQANVAGALMSPTTVPGVIVKGRAARRMLLQAPLVLADGQRHTAETILRSWFEGKSEHTIASYQHDLEDFALFFSGALGISHQLTMTEALARLFQQTAPSAHETVLAFRHYMANVHMAPSTINRHLATLRSVTKLGRQLGMMSWYIEVQGVKAERRRDVRGPSVADVQRLLAATAGETEAETRAYAMVLTFYCLGLRVSELCGLNLEDTDLEHANTWIKGKGRRERELVPLPLVVVDAIRRYLEHRGAAPGPLFQTRGNRRRKNDNRRMETRSVSRVVRALGQRVGLHLWCHGLRHAAITTAIERGQRAGIGLDQIRSFSRHRTLATMLLYRDEHDRTETQRTLGDIVAASLEEGPSGDRPLKSCAVADVAAAALEEEAAILS